MDNPVIKTYFLNFNLQCPVSSHKYIGKIRSLSIEESYELMVYYNTCFCIFTLTIFNKVTTLSSLFNVSDLYSVFFVLVIVNKFFLGKWRKFDITIGFFIYMILYSVYYRCPFNQRDQVWENLFTKYFINDVSSTTSPHNDHRYTHFITSYRGHLYSMSQLCRCVLVSLVSILSLIQPYTFVVFWFYFSERLKSNTTFQKPIPINVVFILFYWIKRTVS